ncbi:hypothetical protein N658DRAFT_556811 [Parathielavia hyrcaniae]|uniref:PH domain-containing protein n=1 Tax=Parathielavia hyrcaniae TaxID=113614 RepID=A0AAN6Q7I9_9PEZI|nr:hypothetical protein N658DRAFT_556811 [Parathielavia hyrcaniae]
MPTKPTHIRLDRPPTVPKKSGRRGGGNATGRRAVIVDGSLQAGDLSRDVLKTSPSFSPAYLLAALEWAEDGETRNVSDREKHRGGPPAARCSRPTAPTARTPAVPAPVLAQKTAASTNLRPRRPTNDDVNNNKLPRRRGGPTAHRAQQMGLLPEKLVFPSAKTPASFLPTPSSVSLDTSAAAIRPRFSPSPISPARQPLHREQHQRRQQHHHQRAQQQQPQQPQQSPAYRNISGQRRPDKQEETSFSPHEVAQPTQPAPETGRIVLTPNSTDDKTDAKQTMYQSMQPSGLLQPSPPQQQQSHRDPFAFLTGGRKKSVSGGSPHSTLTKRSRTLPTSSTSTSKSTATDASECSQSPGFKSSPVIPASSPATHNPMAKSVGVRCRGTTVTIQVTKQTSTADLLQSCSLERRLREYELVWDVVSSWDHDSSNHLVILPDASDPGGELSLTSVPKTLEEPEGFVFNLYLLQRPGKWAQRYITLKENGQMLGSKKRDWKPSDKDVVRLCHLSDFDLYMPTEAEMRKQLRPPKRYCYAIKSQEKASLFLDLNNYVHFFCTEDPDVAQEFRSYVQGWRSWYLVNKKLRLHATPEVPSPSSRSQADYGSRWKASFDQGPRARPSVDTSTSARSIPVSRKDTPTSPSARTGVPPVPPLPGALREKKAALFAENGLLGSGYDERKQEAAGRPRRGTLASTTNEGPFVNGPSLLNNRAGAGPAFDARPRTSGSDGSYRSATGPDSSQLTGWFPSAVQHSAEQRNARPTAPLNRAPSPQQRGNYRPPLPASYAPQPLLSKAQESQPAGYRRNFPGPTQPLIDLTPTFVEPPQWSRENRGRGVRAPQGRPLVDLATGPVLPPSTASRLRDAQPPKSLLRRPEPPPPGGTTLMQQYDLQPRGRGNTVTEGVGLGMGGGTSGGLGRRNTWRGDDGLVVCGGGGGGCGVYAIEGWDDGGR